jgi:hypothetical protein
MANIMSKLTLGMIKEIQGQSPSQKFHMKILAKEKLMECKEVENHVKQLEYEQKKATK